MHEEGGQPYGSPGSRIGGFTPEYGTVVFLFYIAPENSPERAIY
jgi:hypothetical protein